MTARINENYSWDDVIFEFRNKEYGAYQIRKHYARGMFIGLGVTLGVFSLLCPLFAVLKHGPVPVPVLKTILPFPIGNEISHPSFIPPAPPAARHAVATGTRSEIPVIVRTVTTTPSAVKPSPSASNIKGDANDLPDNPGINDGLSGGTGTIAGTGISGKKDSGTGTSFKPIEMMPEYAGGFSKLSAFIARNLHYPEAAVEKKTEGQVVVTFVVGENGRVIQTTVARGIGDGCDEEAARVIRMLKFKPGVQNGHPVKVIFSLPIGFKLNQE